MCQWDLDREELVKWRDLASPLSRTWRELDAQIRALDALRDLLELGVISGEFYRESLMTVAQIDTGSGIYFYTGLT